MKLRELKAKLREAGYVVSSLSPVDAEVAGLYEHDGNLVAYIKHPGDYRSPKDKRWEKVAPGLYPPTKAGKYKRGVLLYKHRNKSFSIYQLILALNLLPLWMDGHKHHGLTRKLNTGLNIETYQTLG